MRHRNTIYICDPDSEYRQELVTQFATAVEDYKLCGLKDLSELSAALQNNRLNKGYNYVVSSAQFFEKGNNGHILHDFIKNTRQITKIKQLIIYSPKSETIAKLTQQISCRKIKTISQNDFTFYRIQNIIRNCVNNAEFNNARLGFSISLITFIAVITWFYSL